MKFSSLMTGFAGLLATTTVVANPMPANAAIQKRSADEVVASIKGIGESLTKLNTTASGYVGGLKGAFTAIKIQIQSSKAGKAIDKATDATKESKEKKFDLPSSQKISSAMLELLPSIQSTLKTLSSKEPEFRKGVLGTGLIPLNPIVKKSLESQKKKSNEFAEVLTPKLDDAFGKIAPMLTKQINDGFDKAIEVFSKKKE